MEDDELQLLIKRVRTQKSDDARVEVKAAGGGMPPSLWESVSAFANTDGGTVILGLAEEHGFEPVPGFDSQRIIDAVEAGLSSDGTNRPKVTPVPEFNLDHGVVDDAPVAILEIEALNPSLHAQGPCYVTSKGPENGSFKRVSDKDKKLSRYEIYVIRSKWATPHIDREPVEGMGIDELNKNLVESLFARAEQLGSRVLDGAHTTDERLRRLSVLTNDHNITLAGALTLGAFPQQYYPQLVIDVSVHPANQKSQTDQLRFLDRQVCDGPIPAAVSDAVRRVLLNLKHARVVEGSGGRDVPEVPEEVLREAMTNAVMHRDYSDAVRGQQVAVDVYPERVEVINPGGLWGDRTIENLDDGRSTSRNPILANLLRWTPREGSHGAVAENQGSGIQRMNAAMRDRGLLAPTYDVDIGWVKVTLHRHGLLNPQTRAWLASLPGSAERGDRESIVLALARERDGVSVADLRHEVGFDSDDARMVLGILLADGVIVGAGDGPYRIAPSKPILTTLEREVLDALNTQDPRTVHELAGALKTTAASLRRVLRNLVDVGWVTPTAPPTSRNRAYLRTPDS